MSDTKKVDLSKLKTSKEETAVTGSNPDAGIPLEASATVEVSTPELIVNTANPEEPEEKQELFAVYHCSIGATNFITDSGHKVAFAKGRFVTQDPNIIAYLDNEIKRGAPFITKGEPMTTAELDPMAELKRQHFEEFMQMQKEGKLNKDMGEYGSGKQVGNITTSGEVAN